MSDGKTSYQVLLIEDNQADARFMQVVLREASEASFHCELASSMEAGLARLEAGGLDLVLLDLTLPGTSGLDTFQRIIEAARDAPIVVLTGLADEDLAFRALQAGAQDYLVKGQVSDEKLVGTLVFAIERYRASLRLRQQDTHLRMLREQLPASFWTTDLDLQLTSVSRDGMFGSSRSAGELTGTSIADLESETDRDKRLLAAHQKAIAGQKESFELHTQGRMYHGCVEPFRHTDGTIIGVIGVGLDVTDQVLVELELRLTRQIQAGLRPQQAPRLHGLDIAAASFAADAAGGDFFDYIEFQDGSTGLVICDVGGKGLGPAILMAQTRAYLRALTRSHTDPGTVLKEVNRFLCEDTSEQRLVALFLAQLDREHRLRYAAAGHRSYLLSADGSQQMLAPTGIPLNIISDTEITTSPSLPLADGDIVLFYTDGIVEAISPLDEPYGDERMVEQVRATADGTAAEIVDGLVNSVRAFSDDDGSDDMTAMVVKRV